MKIVRFKGGLGNQMFQYAFLKNLEVLYGLTNIYADVSDYDKLKDDAVRKLRIEGLNIQIHKANTEDIKSICFFIRGDDPLKIKTKLKIAIEGMFNKRYFFEKSQKFLNIDQLIKYSYFDGYWQSWKYVNNVSNDLRNEFQLKKTNKSFLKKENEIKKEDGVFVGIRCGDYLESKKATRKFGGFQKEYYLNAMEYLAKRIHNPKFYIFSNDLDFVKKNLPIAKYKYEYCNQNRRYNDLEEMFLMGSCKHAVISNSTFNWWGAWLINNKNKIVIAPKKWFYNNKSSDIVPPEWIRL